MAELKRHIGKLNNTGTRVAIVFRTVPDDPTQCLVVETDRLPDLYHDNMMTIIDSKEAQDTVNLYEVLGRRSFGDGQQCLNLLHTKGYLRKMAVTDVTLFPMPNISLPLADANREIDGVTNDAAMDNDAIAEVERVVPELSDDPKHQAETLIVQARLLEEEARSKREKAYIICPAIKPGRGRPELTDTEKELKKVERAEKRKAKREADKKSKLAREAAAKAADDQKKVDDKIVRDAERS